MIGSYKLHCDLTVCCTGPVTVGRRSQIVTNRSQRGHHANSILTLRCVTHCTAGMSYHMAQQTCSDVSEGLIRSLWNVGTLPTDYSASVLSHRHVSIKSHCARSPLRFPNSVVGQDALPVLEDTASTRAFDKRHTPCFKCWPTGGMIVSHLRSQPKWEATRVWKNLGISFWSLTDSTTS